MLLVLDQLRSSDFQPLCGETFSVRLAGVEPVNLELVSVNDLGAARQPEMRRPFSILFLGPESNQYLQQGTYCLEHEQLGALELFIVPLGPQQGRMQYEAIFT